MHYLLRSPDNNISLDATDILGPGCHRLLITGCTYSTIRLQEIARRKLPELAGHRRWRFVAEAEA